MPSVELSVTVVPRSSQRRLERSGDGLKAWIHEAPADGQANQAVCTLIADALGIAKSAVEIVRGQTSRKKTIRIDGIDKEQLKTRLAP